MKYALIKNNQVEEIRFYDNLDLSEVKHQNGLPMLRSVTVISPPYDPTVQVQEGPVYEIFPDSVTETYTVRSKTDADLLEISELEALKQLLIDKSVITQAEFDTKKKTKK